MNTQRTLRAITGCFVIGLLWGGSVSAKPKGKAPTDERKIISETVYLKDVSGFFYGQFPFLKKGFRFLDSSPSVGIKEGMVSSLLVEPAKSKADPVSTENAKPIKSTKDFSPYVDVIKTEQEAVKYTMFLSRKGFPWMEPLRFDYFQDVPFIGIEFVNISSATKAAHSIPPLRVSVQKGKLFKKKAFTVVRTVIPLDQPSLKESVILGGLNPLRITMIGEVTETVTEDGLYSFTLKRIPVKDFPIENPLISLRRSK
jgi:hypothetical protein